MAPFEIVFNSVIAVVVLFAVGVVVNNALWRPGPAHREPRGQR